MGNKTEQDLDAFVGACKDTVYTAINMTRKIVGVGSYFEEGRTCTGVRVLLLRCPNAGLRERKLNGEICIVPEQVTDLCIDGDTATFWQDRYTGSEKRDKYVIFRAGNRNAGIL